MRCNDQMDISKSSSSPEPARDLLQAPISSSLPLAGEPLGSVTVAQRLASEGIQAPGGSIFAENTKREKEECLKQGQNHQRPAHKIASWSQMGQKTQRSREIQDDERKARSALHSNYRGPLSGVQGGGNFTMLHFSLIA